MVPSTGGLAVVPVLIGITFLYISKHVGWDTWKNGQALVPGYSKHICESSAIIKAKKFSLNSHLPFPCAVHPSSPVFHFA